MKKHIISKIIALVLAFTVVFAFAGCNNDNDNAGNDDGFVLNLKDRTKMELYDADGNMTQYWTYDYDGNHNMIGMRIYNYENAGDTEMTLSIEQIYAYDANGNKTLDVYHSRTYGYKYEYVFDANSNKTDKRDYSWDNGEFTCNKHYVYEYNSDNLKTCYKTFNVSGEVETLNSYAEYEYNEYKQLVLQIDYNGDDTINDRFVFEYANTTATKYSKYTHDYYNEGEYYPQDYTTYEYDANGNVTLTKDYSYNKRKSDYEISYVESHVYDASGKETKWQYDEYSNGEIYSTDTYDCYYDERGNYVKLVETYDGAIYYVLDNVYDEHDVLIEYKYSYYDGDEVDEISKYVYTLDDCGNIIREDDYKYDSAVDEEGTFRLGKYYLYYYAD